MNIAICDDCRRDAESLRDMLMQLNDNLSIERFESGRELLSAAKERRYDLVFMDVYLKDENGVDVVRALRSEHPDTQAAFTTISDAHAVDAFSVRAIHYLVKPYTMEDVAETLRRVHTAAPPREPESILTVRIGNDIFTLDQREIVRVESSDHKTNIFLRSGSAYSIWISFKKLAALLDGNFLQIKRGVAVNMRHIRAWRANDVETVDGMSYLLSREQRQQLKETYFAYRMQELTQKQTKA